MEWKNAEDLTEGEGVFNGDIGFITDIDKNFNELTVLFDDTRPSGKRIPLRKNSDRHAQNA